MLVGALSATIKDEPVFISLVVVLGSRLEDIKNARNVRTVIKGGVVNDPQTLFRSAAGKIGPIGPDDHASRELQTRPLRTDWNCR
jgi:hypothetical protein